MPLGFGEDKTSKSKLYQEDYYGKQASAGGSDDDLTDGWDQLKPTKENLIGQIDKLCAGTYGDPEWAYIKEPLQNALDSYYFGVDEVVERRKYQISLTLDPEKNKITIEDNGRGWDKDDIRALYVNFEGRKNPSGNTPTNRRQKGSQGVGIKSTLYQSREFEVEANHEGVSWQIKLSDICDYAEEGFTMPQFNSLVEEGTMKKEGTKVTITPSKEDWVSDYLKEVVIDQHLTEIVTDSDPTNESRKALKMEEVLAWRLLNKTYLGDLMYVNPDETDLPEIELKIIVKKCSIPDLKRLMADTQYKVKAGPHDFIDYHKQIPTGRRPVLHTDVASALRGGQKANSQAFIAYLGKDDLKAMLRGAKLVRGGRKKNAYELRTNDEKLNQKFANLVDESINGMHLLIVRAPTRRPYFHVPARMGLAVHGLVTSSDLKLDKGSEFGFYQAGIHLILDTKEILGVNKENIPSARMGTYNRFITELWAKGLNALTKVILGEQKEERELDAEHIDIDAIPEPDGSYDLDQIGMANEPQREQDVIFAMGHYLGRSDAPPLSFRQHNERTHIDSAAIIVQGHQESHAGEDLDIEYKYTMKDYLESIEKQSPKDFDILVIWKNDATMADYDEAGKGVTVKEFDDLSSRKVRNHKSLFNPDFVKYRLKERSESIGVIVLSELIKSNPDEVAAQDGFPRLRELYDRDPSFRAGGPPSWQHQALEGKLARAGRPDYPKQDGISKDTVDEWISRAKDLGIKTIICILSKTGEKDQLTCYEKPLGMPLMDYYEKEGKFAVHYVDYPDTGGGVSNDLIQETLDKYDGFEEPVLVHCSAGWDRTGSMIEEIVKAKFSDLKDDN